MSTSNIRSYLLFWRLNNDPYHEISEIGIIIKNILTNDFPSAYNVIKEYLVSDVAMSGLGDPSLNMCANNSLQLRCSRHLNFNRHNFTLSTLNQILQNLKFPEFQLKTYCILY